MQIEEGIVSNVYPERGTVRVKRQGNDEVVSAELKVGFPGTLINQFYTMPSIDEHVLCFYPDNSKSKGYVLCAFYSEVSTPPVQDKEKHFIRFKDGTTILYDTAQRNLSIKAEGQINIETEDNINVTSKQIITLTARDIRHIITG